MFIGKKFSIGDFVQYSDRSCNIKTRFGRITEFFVNKTVEAPYPVQATIQPLHTFDSLPRALLTEEYTPDHLFLDEESIETDIDDILGYIDCRWPGQEHIHEWVVRGILYRHPATHKTTIRDPHLRHILPAEIYKLAPAPPHLETLKLFLDIYYDDFGAYRNVYHAVGGVYLVIGNLPLELRQKLQNIFLVGFVPPTVAFDDFIKPFVAELRDLQSGVQMCIGGKNYWVIAGKT